MDPPMAPTMRGPGCPVPPPSDQWYGGLCVSQGNCEAWKPTKLPACGWTRVAGSWDYFGPKKAVLDTI